MDKNSNFLLLPFSYGSQRFNTNFLQFFILHFYNVSVPVFVFFGPMFSLMIANNSHYK